PEPAVLAASMRKTALAVAREIPVTPIDRYSHSRLRVAHISADFMQHPVAYALTALVEGHDRSRIETIGVALAAPDGSEVANQLQTAFDDFIDCSALTDQAVVDMLRRREIDVAIDLMGFTAGARPTILAARVAPVQVNYLGFAGSTGASFMD